MQISEAIISLQNGTCTQFSVPTDDYASKCLLLTSFYSKGTVRYYEDLQGFVSSIQFDQGPDVLHALDLQGDEESIALAIAAGQGSPVLLVGSPKMSKLKSLLVAVAPDEDAGTIPWAVRLLRKAGMEPAKDVAETMLSLTGGDTLRVDSGIKALRAYLGGGIGDVGLDAVRKVIVHDSEPDGKRCLDDLLHQRPQPLLRRMELIGDENLLGLFRAASEELIRTGQVYALESSGKTMDQIIQELGGTYSAQLIRYRYAPLGRALKHGRLQKILTRVNKAEELLRTSRHDKLLVAQAMALDICRI